MPNKLLLSVVFGVGLALASTASAATSCAPHEDTDQEHAIRQQYDRLRAQLEQGERTENQLYQTNLRSCQQPGVPPQCTTQAEARHKEVLAEIAKAINDLNASEQAALAVAEGAGYQRSSTCEH